MLTDTGVSMRQAFGEALLELGRIYPELVVLDADVSSSTQTIHFAREYADRFFNLGVAETNLVDVAGGMAASGLKPVVSTFALFLALKTAEQIRNTICYNKLPVILAGGYAGLSDSFDGASHQSISDLAVMRALPEMKIYVPYAPAQIHALLDNALKFGGPAYIRLSRNPMPAVEFSRYATDPSATIRVTEGRHLTMVACGIPSFMAVEAAVELGKTGIEVDLFLVTSLKPFQGHKIYQSLHRSGRLLTIEEHNVIGGLRSAIMENVPGGLSFHSNYLAIDDTYTETGPYLELLEKYGISTGEIVRKSKQLIEK